MTGSLIGFSGNWSGYSNYSNYRYTERSAAGKTEEPALEAEALAGNDEGKNAGRGNIMTDYYLENPLYRSVQEMRVKEGYEVLASKGITKERLAQISGDEYKDILSRAIADIPFDRSRPYDEETVLILEDGWESMEKDRDYAAWIVGYISEDRSVANPFDGKGDKGSYGVHEFGASPGQYSGHSYSRIYGGTAAGARTMYVAEGGGKGIVTRGSRAGEGPSKDYNLLEESRKAGRRNREEIAEAQLQARTQQKKHINGAYSKIEYENREIQKVVDARRFFDVNARRSVRTVSPARAATLYEMNKSFSGQS